MRKGAVYSNSRARRDAAGRNASRGIAGKVNWSANGSSARESVTSDGGVAASPGGGREVLERSPAPDGDPSSRSGPSSRRTRIVTFFRRRERLFLPLLGAAIPLLLFLFLGYLNPTETPFTPAALEEKILETLTSLPPERSTAAVAHEVIAPSVVRVSRVNGEEDEEREEVQGVGTGVVIDASGLILTSLHVVIGSPRLRLRFADGFETEGTIVSQDPANDLAVVQAEITPEGIPPATIVTTENLSLGDDVVAVGHPFGIGPSVSSGVISGLDRRYATPDGETVFDNLIQFDAAANPGNSGGPLVNQFGEVVGIVSSIYNPTEQRVFIGIGFAVPIETAAAAAGESPF